MNIIQKIIQYFSKPQQVEVSSLEKPTEVTNPELTNGPHDDIGAVGIEVKINF